MILDVIDTKIRFLIEKRENDNKLLKEISLNQSNQFAQLNKQITKIVSEFKKENLKHFNELKKLNITCTKGYEPINEPQKNSYLNFNFQLFF